MADLQFRDTVEHALEHNIAALALLGADRAAARGDSRRRAGAVYWTRRSVANAMRALKYHEHLPLGCPPAGAAEVARLAHRFVKLPVDRDSFLPVAILQPQRAFRPAQRCSAYGLSMFADREQARHRYRALVKKHKGIAAILGSHLASLQLVPAHGLQTRPDPSCHFDLHEYADSDLRAAVAGEPEAL